MCFNEKNYLFENKSFTLDELYGWAEKRTGSKMYLIFASEMAI